MKKLIFLSLLLIPSIVCAKTLQISTPLSLTDNFSVSSTILTSVTSNGSFTIAAGKTLTVSNISARRSTIFLGAGTVTGIKEVFPEWWGDDNSAMEAAFAENGDNPSTVILEDGKDYDITGDVAVTNQYKMLKGGGYLLNGSLIFGVTSGSPVDMHFTVDGPTFEYDSLTTSQPGIVLQNARYGKIINSRFVNTSEAIFITPVDNIQHVTRIKIENNEFDNVNYCLYSAGYNAEGGGKTLTVGELDFTNNHFAYAKITHIYTTGQDGLKVLGNTLYHDGYALESATKEYCIYGNYIVNTVISNTQMYESGYEAIKLAHFRSININSNIITWNGQRDLKDAIYLSDGDTAGAAANISLVSNNLIVYPTKSGIYIAAPSGKLAVTGNIINGAGTDFGQYYGVTGIGTISHYGIDVDSDSYYTSVFGNYVPDNTNNISTTNNRSIAGINYDSTLTYTPIKPMNVTITANSTTLAASGYDVINLNQADPTTVVAVTGGVDGKVITLIATNGNTTLDDQAVGETTNRMVLNGATNVTLTSGQLIVLKYFSDRWREISRNF